MAGRRLALGIACALALGGPALGAEKPIAQAVITKESCASFDAAKAKATTQVKDGEGVYLNVLFPGAVEGYLASWEELPDDGIAGRKLFLLEIGEAGGTEAWDYDLVLPMPGEASGSFLCIGLAPGRVTPVWRGLWLKTVGDGAPGVWKNELRLYDKGDRGEGEKRLVARAPLTASVAGGVSKYAAQLADYKKRFAAGDASFNEPPPKGGLVDKAAIKAALAEAANGMDETPEGAYFTEPDWYIHEDAWGNLDYYHAGAAILYRRDGKSWIRAMDVRKWAQSKKVEVAIQAKELELSTAAYQKALSMSQAR